MLRPPPRVTVLVQAKNKAAGQEQLLIPEKDLWFKHLEDALVDTRELAAIPRLERPPASAAEVRCGPSPLTCTLKTWQPHPSGGGLTPMALGVPLW